MEYQYRFNGEVLKMRMTHRKTGVADLIELYEYSYDHLGRKLSFIHNNNVVAKYSYDAIGRLQIKKFRPAGSALLSSKTGDWNTLNTWQSGILPLGNDNVTINTGHTITIPNGSIASAGILNDKGTLKNFGTFNMGKFVSSDLYVQTFQWHIRGNLRGNNLDASGNLTNSLFSLKLGYEDAGFWDGNIGKQEWKSSLDNVTHSFTMNYDGASRILGAIYSGNGNENYSLDNLSYDLNGNLKTLNRKGKTGTNSWNYIDQLSYVYQLYSNKIKAVNDALLVSNPNVGDFRDSSSIATQYTYNADGSLNSDDNKKITFEWNYLKSPKKITKGSQWKRFIYDASGKLLQTVTSTGKTTDFVGNLTYENNVLYQIAHDEGRINASGQYEYDISDHAKNLRLTFRDSSGIAKVVTKLDYDPWGLRLKGLDYYANSQTFNKFKTFSGKQLHDDFGFNLLSYKFRYHDPELGRFISIDPLAEQYNYNSTFAFAENKLGIGMEYEGLEATPFPASFVFAETVLPRPVIQPNLVRPMSPITRLVPELVGRSVETVSRSSVAENLGRVVNEEQHHLIPRQLKGNDVVKAAREEGFKFEGKENKIGVEKYSKSTGEGRHGNHPDYNTEVGNKIGQFKTDNPGYTPKQGLGFIRGLSNGLKQMIENNPSTKVNDLFKANSVAPSDATKTNIQPKINAPSTYKSQGLDTFI
jgi:RHS repeat-associated protein